MDKITPKDSDDASHLHTDPDTVSRQSAVASTADTTAHSLYKPLFKWEQSTDQTFTIIPQEKSIDFHSFYNTTDHQSHHILSLFGYKVDVSKHVNQFKQKYQKFFIESKSHNALIGRFSELKFGIISMILSLLGVEPNTIETLKKEALKKAIRDNVDCFEQNEYNLEMLMVFTNTKKDTSRVKILTELQKQLITQMNHYGQPDFYSSDMINTIKTDQLNKIMHDLLEEQQNLQYIRNFQ